MHEKLSGIYKTRLLSQGCSMGDSLEIFPSLGRKKSVMLNRTSYTISLGEQYQVELLPPYISLPQFIHEKMEFALTLVPVKPQQKVSDHSRYMLKAISGHPFKINGHLSYQSYVEKGDTLYLGLNKLFFPVEKKEGYSLSELPLKVAISNLNILIEGETGVGKSRLAKIIHEKSNRRGKFVQLNLMSFSQSLLESELFGHVKGAFTGAIDYKGGALVEANHGTLFLDEIDSLPTHIQTKLLTFFDNKVIRTIGDAKETTLDVRIIMASGNSLEQLVIDGRMRKDFFYRVKSSYRVFVRPLRERKEKIEEICYDFCNKHNISISQSLIDYYKGLRWEGNIRELKGHLENKLIMRCGSKLQFDSVDDALESEAFVNFKKVYNNNIISLNDFKKKYTEYIYYQLDQNIQLTSKALKVSYNTVSKLIEERSA